MHSNRSVALGDTEENELGLCRARQIWGTALVECQTNSVSCNWRKSCGYGFICMHSCNRLIAKGMFHLQRED